jgi:hypothetical protein
MEQFNDQTRKRILRNADKSGFFLQRNCARTLKNLGWEVDEEFPVSLPGIETTGDVHAHRHIGRGNIHLILECKRKLGVHWYFFKNLSPTAGCTLPEIAVMSPSQQYPNPTRRYYVTIPYDSWKNPPMSCSVGWENVKDPEGKTKNAVVEASQQAWTAALSTLLKEKGELDDILGDMSGPNYDHEVYIPVVVTGGELIRIMHKTTKYKIGEPTGEVKRIASLIFSLGVPSNLICELDSPLPPIADRVSIVRPDIFVVRHTALGQLVNELSVAIGKSEDKMYQSPDFFLQ